jgi:hypothetical protein
MYLLLFIPSLLYVCYIAYHAVKGTVPVWIETRLYNLRMDPSFKDLSTKRWDTPVGALFKTFSLSVLFTSFIVLTYLTGWKNIIDNNMLWLVVIFIALALTYFIQQNFSRRLRYHHENALRNKQEHS